MPGPPAGPSSRITTTSPSRISSREHGRHRGLLAVEHARRADVAAALVAGELHHAAVRREVAAQDREAAGRLQRIVERAHDALSGGLLGLGGVLADRPAGDRLRVVVQHARFAAGA